jgi:hypothetical protein
MKITIISENEKSKTIDYYPYLYEKLSTKFKLDFININSKKKFIYKNKLKFFFNYFQKNKNPIILNLTESNKYFLYLILIKFYKIPVLYLHAHQNFTKSIYNKNISIFEKICLSLINLDKRIYNILILFKIYKKIDILFSSNSEEILYWKKKSKSFLGFKIKLKKFNKFIKIKDKHFDEFTKEKSTKDQNYFTFIDGALPYHQDQVRFGYQHMDREYYFNNLFKIFNIIKKKFMLDAQVIIHPKYPKNKWKTDYKGLKVTQDFSKKIKFLANCKLVLFHHSAAIMMAIKLNKPIIQISSKKFNNFLKNYDNFFLKKFNLDRIYLEDSSIFKIKNIINKNLKTKKSKNKLDKPSDNFKIFSKEIEKYYYKRT